MNRAEGSNVLNKRNLLNTLKIGKKPVFVDYRHSDLVIRAPHREPQYNCVITAIGDDVFQVVSHDEKKAYYSIDAIIAFEAGLLP